MTDDSIQCNKTFQCIKEIVMAIALVGGWQAVTG